MITTAGKKAKAVTMFSKGFELFKASVLLRLDANRSTSFIQINLLLQAIEVLGKGVLLLKDYDTYFPKLRKYSHRLPKLLSEVRAKLGVKRNYKDFDAALTAIPSDWISLRYADLIDIVHDPNTYEVDILYRETYLSLRWIAKKYGINLSIPAHLQIYHI